MDPSNWAIMKSMCPGIRDNVNMDDLAEYIRNVLAEYDMAEEVSAGAPF